MDLSPKTTSYANVDDNSWLASVHGIEMNRSVTIAMSLGFASGDIVDGYLRPGMALGLKTSTGFYGKYDHSAIDGRQKVAGHLFGTTKATALTGKLGAARYIHGAVLRAKVNALNAITAGDEAPLIAYL